MNEHEKINYVEFPSKDIDGTKAFFREVFGWEFKDFGPDYSAFSDEGLDGGFYLSEKVCSTEDGSALIIFYSQELEITQAKILNAGGKMIRPTFSFPGGRRFHFSDPSGNEYAIWSDKEE
jgi:predicted enzyme related to lactoylglutathione lyase